MFDLKDQVAAVTGASSGLGRQMARAFAAQGANLVIMARRVERLKELKDELEMTDDEWDFTIATDLTSVFKVTRAFAAIMKKNHYGRIINIASMYGLVGNTEIHTVAYHASKGGVVNFTRAVAAELAMDGITCNAICPGYFYTELTTEVLDTDRFQEFAKTHVPMQRYGKEGELNAGAIFLASKEASYVTGLIMPIDGGYTCI